MDINRNNLDRLFKQVVTGFQAGLDQKPPVDLSFAVTEFPGAGAGNFYPWLEQIPGFREWIGERVFNNVKGQKFEVLHRDFELSLSMKEKEILDDLYGLYVSLTQQASGQWPVLLYDLVIEVLANLKDAWDGKKMFADDHKYGDNTIDNLTANALTKANFEAALLAASAWKFSDNRPCRTQFTHLLYGPKLEAVVFDLLLNQYAYDGTDKVQIQHRNFKRVTPVQIPDFIGTYDDYWCLLDCSKGIKPVLRQVRKTPAVIMDTDPVHVALSGEVKILADGRATAAPTFFHLAYGAIL